MTTMGALVAVGFALLLGYLSESYKSLLAPLALVAVAVAAYAATTPGPVADETDVLPGALLVVSLLVLGAWTLGLRLGRR